MKCWLVVLSLLVAVHPALADDVHPPTKCKPPTGTFRPILAQPEIDVTELILWVEGITCKNVIVGPDIDESTKLRVHTPNAITAKQGLKLFEDAMDAAGFVVQDKGDNLVVKLGPGSPKRCDPPPDPVDALLDHEIKKVDDTHVELTTKLLTEIRRNQLGVTKGGTLVQAYSGGKPVGYKLFSAQPFSLYRHLGLANADVVQTINGMPLTTLEQALEAYNKLHDATTFQLGIDRSGKPVTITITLK